MKDYSKELEVAIKAAKKAGKYALEKQENVKNVKLKKDSSPVTKIDFECENIIKDVIKKNYPEHGFLGEEYGRTSGKSEYLWIIDPIDGTGNYVIGLREFGVSIALEKKGEVVLGAIYIPAFKDVYYAIKGKGAFFGNKRMHVSKRKDEAVIMNFGSSIYKFKDDFFKIMGNLSPPVSRLRIWGSAVVNMMHVAAGRCELYIDKGLKPWDVAAACLILKEAGGKITKFDGSDWNHYDEDILASNRIIHKAIIKRLIKVKNK